MLNDPYSSLERIERERDDAEEAAETYWEAWQDAAVYWKEKVQRLEDRLDNSRAANCLRQRRLEAAVTERDQLRAALEKYGNHHHNCEWVQDDRNPCDCGLTAVLKLRP